MFIRPRPVLLLLCCLLLAGCPGRPTPNASTRRNRAPTDEALEQARETLTRASDLTTCRTALQQVNLHLGRNPELRPAMLTPEQRRLLQEATHFNLNAAELAEVESASFTLLDGPHLEACLLFRDAARSLEPDGLTQAERTERALAWVVRQVRLRDGRGEEPAPPHYVARRGSGSVLERGLVLLALLEQLDVPGCLIGPATDASTATAAWGCGALVTESDGSQQIRVCDLRLGLMLPGNLAQLRKSPNLLEQLTVDPMQPYDLTKDQIANARLYPAGLLSNLTPRMRYLQEQLPSGESSVRLAIDPVQQLALWKGAAGDVEVRLGRAGLRTLRTFLPEDEGGVDRTSAVRRFESGLVPWTALPERVLALPGEPGARLQSYFGGPFRELYLQPGSARDLLLRGRANDAANQLVEMRRIMETQKQLLAVDSDVDAQLAAWMPRVIAAQGELVSAQNAAARDRSLQPNVEIARARVNQVYRSGEKMLVRLLDGRGAQARSAEVLLLLGLCMHEQAERLEARLDKARRAGKELPDSERREAREAWREAAARWEMYAKENPTATNTPAVRRLWARALAADGDPEKTAAAIALLEDLSGNLTTAEKTAHLYQASLLKKK